MSNLILHYKTLISQKHEKPMPYTKIKLHTIRINAPKHSKITAELNKNIILKIIKILNTHKAKKKKYIYIYITKKYFLHRWEDFS